MDIKKFAKDHKKELIIGGVIVTGVTVGIILHKKRLVAAMPTGENFQEIMNMMLRNWDDLGVTQMVTGNGRIANLGEIGQYMVEHNNADSNDLIQFIIAHVPDVPHVIVA